MFELTRRFPFGSMFEAHRELDDLLGRFFGHAGGPVPYRAETEPVAWWPAVESYAKDGDLHVRVALPGVDPKDVEVTVSDDYLVIRGERKGKTEEKDGGRYVREFAYGSFERTFALPEGIDPGKVHGEVLERHARPDDAGPGGRRAEEGRDPDRGRRGPGQGHQGRLTASGHREPGPAVPV